MAIVLDLTNDHFYEPFMGFPINLKIDIIKLLGEEVPEEKRNDVTVSIITRVHQDNSLKDSTYNLTRTFIEHVTNLPFSTIHTDYPKLPQDLYVESKNFENADQYISYLASFYSREAYKIIHFEELCNKNDIESELFGSESSPGLILKTTMKLCTFAPIIALWDADKMLSDNLVKKFTVNLPDKRKNYIDSYFRFPIDLSQLIIVFIFTDIQKVPLVFTKTMRKMEAPNLPQLVTENVISSSTQISNVVIRPLNPEMFPNVILGTSVVQNNNEPSNSGNTSQESFQLNELVFNLNPSEKYTFNMSDFEEKDYIHGARGHIVKKYLHQPSQKLVVIKYIQIPKSNTNVAPEKSPLDEINILKKVARHENIVDFYGITVFNDFIVLCMECMDVPLTKIYLNIHSKGHGFPEKLLGFLSCSILNALNFCYSRENLIHRDIKPANILVNWSGEIKLADFGESRVLVESVAQTFVGTLMYLAPERWQPYSTYDIRSDIWSVGITLLECILGNNPLKIDNGLPISGAIQQQILSAKEIMKNDSKELLKQCPVTYTSEFKEFLTQCLEKFENRPKYGQLMEMAFYKSATKISKTDICSILQYYKD